MQCRFKGQARPFIDKDLQFQVPGVDNYLESHEPSCYTNIYLHYTPSFTLDFFPLNYKELEKAIDDAQNSYEAWGKMQKQLELLMRKDSIPFY